MLDNATLTLLTRLKILAKKTGVNIDLIKMSGDKDYAALMLKELSNSDDPELVQIVIHLMNQFGMIKAPETGTKAKEADEKDQYIGRLR